MTPLPSATPPPAATVVDTATAVPTAAATQPPPPTRTPVTPTANDTVTPAPAVCVDTGEPNSTQAQAQPLALGTQLPAQFCQPGDEDWYAFTLDGPIQRVTIETLALGADVDTVIELYAADGRILLASNDDRDRTMQTVLGSRITQLLPGGAYLLRVRNLGAVGAGARYDLQVTAAAVPLRKLYLPLAGL
jgi:hypothetical protein